MPRRLPWPRTADGPAPRKTTRRGRPFGGRPLLVFLEPLLQRKRNLRRQRDRQRQRQRRQRDRRREGERQRQPRWCLGRLGRLRVGRRLRWLRNRDGRKWVRRLGRRRWLRRRRRLRVGAWVRRQRWLRDRVRVGNARDRIRVRPWRGRHRDRDRVVRPGLRLGYWTRCRRARNRSARDDRGDRVVPRNELVLYAHEHDVLRHRRVLVRGCVSAGGTVRRDRQRERAVPLAVVRTPLVDRDRERGGHEDQRKQYRDVPVPLPPAEPPAPCPVSRRSLVDDVVDRQRRRRTGRPGGRLWGGRRGRLGRIRGGLVCLRLLRRGWSFRSLRSSRFRQPCFWQGRPTRGADRRCKRITRSSSSGSCGLSWSRW